MTGLFIFFLIYISILLGGVFCVWYLINTFDEIIIHKNSSDD